MCLGLTFPCLACTSCFAPESPRFLLLKGKKTVCVDSLQWLRGHLSDLGSEFSHLSDYLSKSVGADGVFNSLTKRSVLAPVALSVLLVILTSCNGLVTFNLLFVSQFSGQILSVNMLLVAAAMKIVGSLGCLLVVSRSGMKMILLLGSNRTYIYNDYANYYY